MREDICVGKLLKINPQKHKTIAVTGGGGKTSLIFQLAKENVKTGKKVIVTTTTHMAFEPDRPYAEQGEWSVLRRNLREHGYCVTAILDREKGKIGSPTRQYLISLMAECGLLLVEADGAKGFPLKVPESFEPVIPEWTDLVIGMTGLDCLGKKIKETAHRPWNVAKFLGKKEEDPVEIKDVIKIASSENGLRKSVGSRDYRVYLNKLDTLEAQEVAEQISGKLREQGIYTAYGSLKNWI